MRVRGFTLIEMIVTIIIVAVISLGVAGFLEFGTLGFAQTVERQKLHTQAQFILQKMSRELRHAVPNSIKVEDNCIGFYPIKYSGFYQLSGASSPYSLDFISGQEGLPTAYAANDFMVINPTSREFVENEDNHIPLDGIEIVDSKSQISLDEPLLTESVANRHYITDEAIDYCFDQSNGLLRRKLHKAPEGTGDIVADSIQSMSFDFSSANLVRGGLVHFEMMMSYRDEQATYQQEVQVLNVP
ncbi:PulJ/GspJ family protein [Vibrio astriarenae]